MTTPALAPTQKAPESHTEYYRRILHDLIDMGADLARQIHAQGTADTPSTTTPPQDPTIPFDRIARTIRRTVLLAQQLDHPRPTRLGRDATRVAARRRIIRAVQDAIQRPFEDPAQARSRESELRERLDAPELNEDLDHDLATRPIADIITEICNDLGLGAMPGTRPYQRRTPKDVETLRTLAASPSRTRPRPLDRWPPEPP